MAENLDERKQSLYREIVAELTQDYTNMLNSADEIRKEALGQEDRMKTRYDTRRIEGSWLADSLQERVNDLERQLGMAQGYVLSENPQRIEGGTLVHISSPPRASQYFFLLPFKGGSTYRINEEEVVVITPQAPLAQAMIDRSVGETFRFRDRDYLVEEIV